MKRRCTFEDVYWVVVVALSALTVISLVVLAIFSEPAQVEAEPPAVATDEYIVVEIVHETGPVPEPKQTPETPRYELTITERDVLERVVMAEGGNTEDDAGLMYIAQCILNASEFDGIRPDEAVILYQYAPPAEEVNDRAKKAVARVFDLGETVTDEPILFFYAPQYCQSDWHESLHFVTEHGGHRFFKLKENKSGL